MFSGFFVGKGNALEQAEACARGRGVKQDRIAAEALYQQAVQEKLPGAHFRMGLFYHHQPGRDAEAAEAYFNAFLDGDLCAKVALKELIRVPSVAAYCYLGKIFEAEGNRLEARKAYQAAEAKLGGAASVHSTLSYARPAVTTFLRPTVMRKTAGDLFTKIHQFSHGAE